MESASVGLRWANQVCHSGVTVSGFVLQAWGLSDPGRDRKTDSAYQQPREMETRTNDEGNNCHKDESAFAGTACALSLS